MNNWLFQGEWRHWINFKIVWHENENWNFLLQQAYSAIYLSMRVTTADSLNLKHKSSNWKEFFFWMKQNFFHSSSWYTPPYFGKYEYVFYFVSTNTNKAWKIQKLARKKFRQRQSIIRYRRMAIQSNLVITNSTGPSIFVRYIHEFVITVKIQIFCSL